MKIPSTKLARHEAIRKIIRNKKITSQASLLTELEKLDIKITQATLSRDLDELNVNKVQNSNTSHYVINSEKNELSNLSLNKELIVGIDHSANIVVVRTPPGGAQFFASSVDNANFSKIIGTIAGDDTVLLVTKDPNGAEQIAQQLWEISSSNR